MSPTPHPHPTKAVPHLKAVERSGSNGDKQMRGGRDTQACVLKRFDACSRTIHAQTGLFHDQNKHRPIDLFPSVHRSVSCEIPETQLTEGDLQKQSVHACTQSLIRCDASARERVSERKETHREETVTSIPETRLISSAFHPNQKLLRICHQCGCLCQTKRFFLPAASCNSSHMRSTYSTVLYCSWSRQHKDQA